jgi:hypothetical protein
VLPQDGRPDGAEKQRVDPDRFAEQVNYLAALGRLVVPRALAFAGLRILFVGHEPFDAEELGGLLPDGTYWYEQQYAPDGFGPDVVVLGRTFPRGLVESALEGATGSPKVVPQEGFLDELLFGHDWSTVKREALREMAGTHPGLQAAMSVGALSPVGTGAPAPRPVEKRPPPALDPSAPDKWAEAGLTPVGTDNSTSVFSWPSTAAKETGGKSEGEYDLRDRSRLKELGYDTTKSPSARWRILTTEAVPELGLPRVAGLIAWFCRSRKAQRGGRQKFARAIGEWEHDLERLRREFYPSHRPRFNWPRSDP